MPTASSAFARRTLDLVALFCVAALRVGLVLLPFGWLMRLQQAAAGSVRGRGSTTQEPKLPKGPWSEVDVRSSVHRASQPSELKIGVAKDTQKGL